MAENLERNIFAVCRDLTKHGKSLDIVYDIGANDGRWTANVGRKLPQNISINGKQTLVVCINIKYLMQPDTLRCYQIKIIKRCISILVTLLI